MERQEAEELGIKLVEHLGFLTVYDIRGYSAGIVGSLLQTSFSDFTLRLLKDVFHILPNTPAPPCADMCVGRGYNILTDKRKPSYVFEIESGDVREALYGFSSLLAWPCLQFGRHRLS
jgi:hypothetical protein